MTGFVRVLGNPGILLYWIVLSASFISRDWVEPTFTDKAICVVSVGIGTDLWFTGLSYAVSRGHKKFKHQTLLLLEHGSGVGLLLLGLFHGGQLIWNYAHHKF
jgi:threonine/homoserine/homoserine lactone efflux protein